jgi:hypothetical protein
LEEIRSRLNKVISEFDNTNSEITSASILQKPDSIFLSTSNDSASRRRSRSPLIANLKNVLKKF